MMDELLEQFLIEGRELVAQVDKDLKALARDPRADAAIDSAFRAIHTLKGSVAIFAMQPAERLLHAAEDLLERARRGTATLDPHMIEALVACLDQTDRWIDDMERQGTLSADAMSTGAAIASRLTLATASAPALVVPGGNGSPNWVAALTEREKEIIARTDAPLTAFRYVPDRDCFFRGEDPLAVVEGVPELLTLAILPAGESWPSLQAIEPFACISVLEGLSAAPVEAVRAAFRMQPDQLLFAAISPTADLERSNEGRSNSRLLRVDAARVDAMADGLGDLIVAINALTPVAEDIQRHDRALAMRLRSVQATIERATSRLHRDLSAVRLVPLEPALRRLPRLTREIADSLGKVVTLKITGETIEVDKQIADGLFEPLLHLLRNALDHGIETPDRRKKAGKAPSGTIGLAVERDGDRIIVTLEDDGAGMDPGRIRELALARGLISAESAGLLTEAAALRLIFLPGFSTATEITEVSGRGVGMDAVQAAMEKLQGSIEVESKVGRGTCFRLNLPANALTTRLLVVEVAGERYGISLAQVVETVRIDKAALMPVGGGLACVLRDRTVPVLDLASLLNGSSIQGQHAKLVIIESQGGRIAMRVDAFAERIDTVVRPPLGILTAARGVVGAALMGDGDILLVLDLPELAA